MPVFLQLGQVGAGVEGGGEEVGAFEGFGVGEGVEVGLGGIGGVIVTELEGGAKLAVWLVVARERKGRGARRICSTCLLQKG